MTEIISEYQSDDGKKTSSFYKEGKWFIAKLMADGKVVTHTTSFNRDDVEYAAKEWVK